VRQEISSLSPEYGIIFLPCTCLLVPSVGIKTNDHLTQDTLYGRPCNGIKTPVPKYQLLVYLWILHFQVPLEKFIQIMSFHSPRSFRCNYHHS
jgi:hypothetical protein